jgi:hypothetical protein
MTTPSIITTRRFSPPLRLKLQVIFAKAWEALAETYRLQAADFVHRVAAWLPIDEALDRFFREVGVPASMVDTVRARSLIALAPLIDRTAMVTTGAAEVDPEGPAAPWLSLRIEQLVGTLRQRAQYVEETNLQCRLAACVADEAVAATHVRMAIEIADALAGELPLDEAIMHYVRTFNLPALEAQIIFQRTMARWAARHTPGADPVLAPLDADAVCARAPALELAPRSFGLRLRALV